MADERATGSGSRGYRLPLRARITLWVLVIVAVVHVALSLLFILYRREHFARELRDDLRSTAHAVAGRAQSATSTLDLFALMNEVTPSRWGGLWGLLLSDDGSLLAHTGFRSTAHAENLATGAHALTREASLHLASANDGEEGQPRALTGQSTAFVYAVARAPDGAWLVVAADAREVGGAVSFLAATLMTMLPISLLSSGVATWTVTGLAFRPIHQIQQIARNIAPGHLPQRLDIDAAGPEIEALQQELQDAMKRVEAGYETQARFLATVSHELKTPISVVAAEANALLVASPSEDDYASFVRSTSEEMQRLGRVVESFLSLTRLRQGKLAKGGKHWDANEILLDAIGQCAQMASQYGVRLNTRLFEGEEAMTVFGNAELLQTAICNLIRNAIRFSPRGEPIEIACCMVDHHILYDVRDYGPGMPAAMLEKLFEPYSHASPERRDGRSGGLNLQIAQGIAELHGGAVTVENLEPGCRFRIRLPISQEG